MRELAMKNETGMQERLRNFPREEPERSRWVPISSVAAVGTSASKFSKRVAVLFAIWFVSMAFIAGDWRERPSYSWTWQDVLEILNQSPWARVSSTGFSAPAVGLPPRIVPFFPIVRLMTAKPIRDAYLRVIFFSARSEPVIDIKRLGEDPDKKAREALELFAKSFPDDIRLKGDPEHIVVSITFDPSHMVNLFPDVTLSDPFEGIQQSDLSAVTFLSMRTGKHLALDHYSPKGKDNLGAKFFFPRFSPDGVPSIVKEDKELRFETRIKGKRIEVRFNLAKLIYQGNLEL
jgi:hypothetical protein